MSKPEFHTLDGESIPDALDRLQRLADATRYAIASYDRNACRTALTHIATLISRVEQLEKENEVLEKKLDEWKFRSQI